MKTEELIGCLANEVKPVGRLRQPQIRLLLWLGLSLPWIAFLAWYMGLRSDLALKVAENNWLFEQSLAFLTAMAAGLAALCASVPGRPVWERLVPVLPLVLWIGAVVRGSMESILEGGTWTSLVRVDWACFPYIVLLGLIPAAVMIALVRKGAPVSPYTTIAYAALAATALALFGLRLFHAEDASLMILIWQMGSVALLTAGCVLFAKRLFPWRLTAETVNG